MYEHACGFHWHTGTSLHVCVLESFIKLCHSPNTKSSCKLCANELHISQVYTHTWEESKRFCCNSEFHGFNRSSDYNSQVYILLCTLVLYRLCHAVVRQDMRLEQKVVVKANFNFQEASQCTTTGCLLLTSTTIASRYVIMFSWQQRQQ